MTDAGGLLSFLLSEGGPRSNAASNIEVLRNTGVLPYQRLAAMIKARTINSKIDIETDQIQPASLDLRLGRYAYQVRASFLPGPKSTAMDRIKELQVGAPIDLEGGAVLQRRAVYVVELMEAVSLNADTFGVANPKSSTGRLDVLTRLITDKGTAFDRIEKGYEGNLFVEIAPLTFSIIVRPGARLIRVRLHQERGTQAVFLIRGRLRNIMNKVS